MRRHSRVVVAGILFVAIAGLSACGTPEPIKRLSTEQLAAQNQIRTAIDESFNRMEAVVQRQLDEIERTLTENNRKTLVGGAAGLQAQGTNLTPEQFADITLKAFAERRKILVDAGTKLTALKQAHQNVLKAYDTMLEAQRTLDRYLQLEQADEQIANELLASLGIQRQQLVQWMNTGLDAFSGAQAALESLA